MKAVEVKNLTFSYPGASRPVLKNVNISIEKGDFIAIVGNNGCGKSTLCKTLNGLIPHFISGDFEGTVFSSELNTLENDIGFLASKVGYVYQDFENQIVRPTALDDASYACLNYVMPDYEERGQRALKLCGLEEKKDSFIWQLSGGQTHLLALAGVLSLEPDTIILDEPIAQLDPLHADMIYEILKELNEKHGKTIIVIEHHTEYIADYCKNVLLMKDGEVKWCRPTNQALFRVDELVECNIFPPQITLAAHKMVKSNEIFIESENLPITIEDGKRVFSMLSFNDDETKREIRNTCTNGSAVSIQNVSVNYKTIKGEPNRVFENLNLNIKKGDKIAIIGSNGAGKSTLMKLMIGMLKPSSGEIYVNGQRVLKKSIEKLSEQISLVYQNPEDMFINDSIKGDISFAMKMRGEKECDNHTAMLLERFRLTDLKDSDGRLVSGGQMRRASLAIGVALKPEILLLDEPTANLDIATRKEIMSTIKDLKGITETVLISTHDMQLVCEWAERIIVISQGEIIADGTRNEIFGNEKVCKIAGIRPPEIFEMAKSLNENAFCYTIDEFVKSFKVEVEKV